jgi:diguanylate cyclase (GGDEF)-like protein
MLPPPETHLLTGLDEQVQRQRLRVVLRGLTAAALVSGLGESVAAVWLVAAAVLTTGYGIWLSTVSRGLLHEGRVSHAAASACGGLLLVISVAGLAAPGAAGVLAMAAVLAVVLSLPFLEDPVLRPMVVIALVVVIVVAIADQMTGQQDADAGARIGSLIQAAGLICGAGLVMMSLWQSRQRLDAALGRIGVAIAALKATEAELSEVNSELRTRVADLQARDREVTQLAELGELLEAAETQAEASAVLARDLAALFPAESGSFYSGSDQADLLVASAVWGPAHGGPRIDGPRDCWAIRRGRLHTTGGVEVGPWCAHVDASVPGGSICLPVSAHGRQVGLLHVRMPELPADRKGTSELEDRIRLASTVAEHIGIRLANLELRATPREQSIRDPLTGLYNRRHMEDALERELSRAQRDRSPLGVILLDLDHFKQLNDQYGHAAGDVVLRRLGRMLQARVRAEDICCRYGGEEFLVILPRASMQDTLRRAEALRVAAAAMRAEPDGIELPPVTLSMGVACFPEHGLDPSSLIQAADEALYRAKAGGRDRVEAASAVRARPRKRPATSRMT